MPSTRLARSLAVAAIVGLFAACTDPAAAPLHPEVLEGPTLATASDRSTAPVMWHPQQAALGNTGGVEGASAHVVRTSDGISVRMTTHSLTPGNAYTLWLVTLDNPGACPERPCTAPDILLNPDTEAQVRFAAGNVAGGSGRATFAASITTGPLTGWLPDREFTNPMGAEIHLVINDHGPMIPEFMPGMIHTYRGGCSDDSPFPPVFPETALADGEVGPNICRLYQSAVLMAEG
jgi:hypothetical protein